MTGMTVPQPNLRWYHLTPDRLILALLVVECLLWLSERFQWFGFNECKGWTVLIAAAVVGVALLLWLLSRWQFSRWRFQFSIRSLFVLTAAVAIACSAWAVEVQERKWQREAVAAIEELHGNVLWSIESSAPAWLQSLLGNAFFRHVHGVFWIGPQGTDADLKHLVKHLERLDQLEVLVLWQTRVTDAGLEDLKGLSQLQTLSLTGTKVTDAGLEHLKALSQLQELDLNETQVTKAGVKEFQKVLPTCVIRR